eukprot:CAMPEP_0196725240 /NCGR_PEP_ID=MMETSP1091-20130531/6852_1 /TAXON_ID=302021 /ORGANISM="Rhodomonas sp., Strain CCMP768" /LENGTH=34 /DNA_ID= /DNA_START= /DNA_END= /DNA_ORIENTATION=
MAYRLVNIGVHLQLFHQQYLALQQKLEQFSRKPG